MSLYFVTSKHIMSLKLIYALLKAKFESIFPL